MCRCQHTIKNKASKNPASRTFQNKQLSTQSQGGSELTALLLLLLRRLLKVINTSTLWAHSELLSIVGDSPALLLKFRPVLHSSY